MCEYVEVVQVCDLLSSSRHLVDVKGITEKLIHKREFVHWSICSRLEIYEKLI